MAPNRQEEEIKPMKCAIYTRVSTDSQAEKEYNSCEAQEEKIKAYIRSDLPP